MLDEQGENHSRPWSEGVAQPLSWVKSHQSNQSSADEVAVSICRPAD